MCGNTPLWLLFIFWCVGSFSISQNRKLLHCRQNTKGEEKSSRFYFFTTQKKVSFIIQEIVLTTVVSIWNVHSDKKCNAKLEQIIEKSGNYIQWMLIIYFLDINCNNKGSIWNVHTSCTTNIQYVLLSVEIFNLFRMISYAKLCGAVCKSLCVLLVNAVSFVSLARTNKSMPPMLFKFFRSKNS